MKNITLFIAFLLTLSYVSAQEEAIDASKPTNFYSLLDNTIENTSSPGQNVFGYRGKVMLAPSEKHLILAELPLMYNDRTEEFGIGDIRTRYFYLPYKNYDKFLGAFGPSVDVFAPTGNYRDGLGSGRWIISPGFTVGMMASDWIQFFPIVSYQYSSLPQYSDPSPEEDQVTHGVTFQVITPIVFSEKFFVQVTPVFKINDVDNSDQNRFVQELFASYSLSPKMQVTGFYNGNFEDQVHQVSFGLTVFL